MRRPSASGRFAQISAGEIPERTPQDMARLRAAMDIPVELSEDLESSQPLGPEVRRDASGRIVKRPLGQLRAAILAALDHHQMTRYELWKKAHARCDSLSASAVYEYLRGEREIGSEYMEALIEAARLKVVDRSRSRAAKPTVVAPIDETSQKPIKARPHLAKKISRPAASSMITVSVPPGTSKDSKGRKRSRAAMKASRKSTSFTKKKK